MDNLNVCQKCGAAFIEPCLSDYNPIGKSWGASYLCKDCREGLFDNQPCEALMEGEEPLSPYPYKIISSDKVNLTTDRLEEIIKIAKQIIIDNGV